MYIGSYDSFIIFYENALEVHGVGEQEDCPLVLYQLMV